MFTSMDVELPLPTRMLISATDFMSHNKLYILIGGVVIAILVLWSMKQPRGRRILDRVKIKAPIIGPPTLLGEFARFSRTVAVLVDAGLNLQEVMQMATQSADNSVVRDALERVREGLLLGGGLSEPMSHMSIFPPLLIQMVSVGEESNSLAFTMGIVADFYETMADEKTSTMVSMIGPLSTVLIALVVGGIALAVMMPMYSITGAF
jgi:type IV pilus assembly protein PilC